MASKKRFQRRVKRIELPSEDELKITAAEAAQRGAQNPRTAQYLWTLISDPETKESELPPDTAFNNSEDAAYEGLRELTATLLEALKTSGLSMVQLRPRSEDLKTLLTTGRPLKEGQTTPKNRLIQSFGRSFGLRRRTESNVPSKREAAQEAFAAALGGFTRAASEGLGFTFVVADPIPSQAVKNEWDPVKARKDAWNEIEKEARRLGIDKITSRKRDAESRVEKANDEGLDPRIATYFSLLGDSVKYPGAPPVYEGDALGAFGSLLTAFLLALAGSGIRVADADGGVEGPAYPTVTVDGLEKAGEVMAKYLRRRHQKAVATADKGTTEEAAAAAAVAGNSYADDAAGALQRLGDAALLAAMSEDPSNWRWWLDAASLGLGLVATATLGGLYAGIAGGLITPSVATTLAGLSPLDTGVLASVASLPFTFGGHAFLHSRGYGARR